MRKLATPFENASIRGCYFFPLPETICFMKKTVFDTLRIIFPRLLLLLVCEQRAEIIGYQEIRGGEKFIE